MSKITTIAEINDITNNALSVLSDGSKILHKSYLSELGSFDIMNCTSELNRISDVRIFQVSRIVLENKQSVLESTVAAYTALGTAGYTVFFILKSDGFNTYLYLGTRGEPKRSLGQNAGELLEQVMNGHFSGSYISNLNYEKVDHLLSGLDENAQSITAVTGVPSLSIEDKEHFIQGLEHFIDAAEGKKYQAIILAEPVSAKQLEYIRTGYEQIATQLSPLLKQTLSFGENEAGSIGLAVSESLSQSLGTSFGLTETKGTSQTYTDTFTKTTGYSDSYSKSVSNSYSIGIGSSAGILPQEGAKFSLGGFFSLGYSRTEGTTNTHTNSFSESEGSSRSSGLSNSFARSENESKTDTNSHTKSLTDTVTKGESRQITLESVDKHIEQLLCRVDHQLERIEDARQYGAWNSAAYFIGDSQASSEALASIFLGLIRGINSGSEDCSLTTWSTYREKENILQWLKQLTHPRLNNSNYKKLNIPYFTPATLISTKEMAIQLGLPRCSTSAVTVIQTQSFGRKIQKADDEMQKSDKEIELGNIYHLWNEIKSSPIKLDLENLSSHIFVSGSTGSGKSNTIYNLLQQLKDVHGIPFMVIEPAKGEYKHVFGNHSNISIFGTNPSLTELLRINPFRFPKDIHVLEHIDRLIEIFNVCWPMYAAMPAVLKDAILNAYQACGWNLESSCHELETPIYPSFNDLLIELKRAIDKSEFSAEVKSNYIGALVTRVKSMTNGLNGQIFSDKEINNQILFDSNVIIDLSRIGSQETKSLIMGILIMRLSEHRMANSGMNKPLSHVTVLEEAHNILKRTSIEQNSEGSNVAGKSVEMLSNAIAEMRTYGEGFIIVDQSPSAVDISAIRNTNTKIIMRLPDESDRRLAGKASGLKDIQLEEIAKLPKGVAVVYQNDWLEPVLCKIKHVDVDNSNLYQFKPSKAAVFDDSEDYLTVINFLLYSYLNCPKNIDSDMVLKSIERLNILSSTKLRLFMSLKEYSNQGNVFLWDSANFDKLSHLLSELLGLENSINDLIYLDGPLNRYSLSEISAKLNEIIRGKLENVSLELLSVIQLCLVRNFGLSGGSSRMEFYKAYKIYHEKVNVEE